MTELWKDVFGYEDHFQISNLGNFYSKRSGRVLKQHLNKQGYKTIATKIGGRDGTNICFKVHRLVAQAFSDNPKSLNIVNHIDGNKENNVSDNLEWCTSQENTLHAIQLGLITHKKIEDKGLLSVKLNREDCEFIVNNYTPRDSKFGARALGRKFSIRHKTVVDIFKRGCLVSS